MKDLYQQLGNLLASIEPTNERARRYRDLLILRCAATANGKLAHAESVQGIRFDFHLLMKAQDATASDSGIFSQIQNLLSKLETGKSPASN